MNLEKIMADHQLWLDGKGGERANLTGARLNRARLNGANLTGAYLAGARLNGADLTGADMTGARLNRADMTGAMTGAIIDDNKTVVGLPCRATRSDGYEFFLWHCQEGFYIVAGCRFFTPEAARAHWTATRSGTPLGDETQDILDIFEKAIQRTGEKP